MVENSRVDLTTDDSIKLYRRRWIILLLFVLYSSASAMQWFQYAIIANIIGRYYNVDDMTVNWTSLISMVMYPLLILPTSYIIDKLGLRVCAVTGAVVAGIGTWVKVLSVRPDLFAVAFLGQFLLAISQMFILSLPPKVAAVWFGPKEVSTACALGVFGTQLGVVAGFLLPPILVQNHDSIDDISTDLYWMLYSFAIYTSITVLAVIFFFRDKPDLPPSAAELQRVTDTNTVVYGYKDLIDSYKELLTSKSLLLLTFAYGINTGVAISLSTVLNQIVLFYFSDGEQLGGRLGVTILVTGMIGAVVFGVILDKTRKYKQTLFGIYIMTIVGVVFFMFALKYKEVELMYTSAAFLGFFLMAYYSMGFEYATELTYPQPESTSSGILTSMGQIFGIIFTYMLDEIIGTIEPFWAIFALTIAMGVGAIISAFIPNDLRRQRLQNSQLEL